MSIVTADDLRARLAGVATITDAGLEVSDERRFREEIVDGLAFEAVFADDAAVRDAARWVIWSASQALGCGSASIHDLYRARGRGEVDATRFTVPAINVRAATYLTARQAFAAALERDAATVIFEIAKSEMAYTDQRPGEYAAVVLAAALREGWRTPVFLQGDHFQFNATKWAADPGPELEGIKDLTREAVGAGFLNIDIDTSTLVDLSLPTVPEQQRVERREHRRADAPRALAPAGGRDDQRRRRDRRGRQVELDRRGAACLPRRLPGRCAARSSRSARSASRPARATAACRCRTGRLPR